MNGIFAPLVTTLAGIATSVATIAASVVLWVRAGTETALANAGDFVRLGPGVATSGLHLFRSLALARRAVAATDTYDNDDCIIEADATGGAVVLNLPPAANCPGRLALGKKVDAGANPVTMTPNGADTIEGAANLALAAQWDGCILVSDGVSDWRRYDA